MQILSVFSITCSQAAGFLDQKMKYVKRQTYYLVSLVSFCFFLTLVNYILTLDLLHIFSEWYLRARP